ncbi:hypothetical protein F5148DRAFT_1367050 [Russula earlei]|uniref:Uncharacterized protein n=1 Tax=Russula earlei TaxID=71964 RepID=A0ACC0UD29_9AGAM|nr:hypothetical protein F5148DRAFT_1367050 [Russula earlei]
MPFRNEKFSTPVLRLEIADGYVTPPSPSSGVSNPPSPSFRQRARSLSNVEVPSRRSSQSNIDSTTSPLLSPAAAFPAPPLGLSKARDESQKLLAHVLEQLRRRPKCPPSNPMSFQIASEAKLIVPRPSASRTTSETPSLVPENDETSERIFSPDSAFDLMNRLRDVLMISMSRGWQIFNESTSVAIFAGGQEVLDIAAPSSPFRRRRRGTSFDAKRPSSTRSESTELLSQCISVLQSIVSEDCRFQLAPPRPSRPPNALQAITLDIALLLVHLHARSHVITSQIGFALLPAFATFRPEMYPRLLLFWEGMLRGMLHEERELRSFATREALSSQEHFAGLQAEGAPPPAVSIQIEPHEEANPYLGVNTRSWISYPHCASRTVPSQSASGQCLASCRRLSLVSPLLAAILDAIDFGEASTSTVHRLRHLLSMIITLRPNASLNVLEVIAYHTPKTQSRAVDLLYSYWPRALGHCVITRPFRSLANAYIPPHHPHAHQFGLWRFTEPSTRSLFDGNIYRECRSCTKQIIGLGLFCSLCICAVHFDCYDNPDGNLLTEYPAGQDSGARKVAVHRFCHVQHPTSGRGSHVQHISGHTFRIVNMFTLALCFSCKLPLWGFHSQGLKCDNCNHFVHARCTLPSAEIAVTPCHTTQPTSAHRIISPYDLRDSFDNHFKGLLRLDPDSMHQEENLIVADILWVQLQILNNGLALSSVIIEGGDDASKPFALKLHSFLDHFRAALTSQNPPLSDALNIFFEECRSPSRDTLLFDWSTLVFLATSAKFQDDAPSSELGHPHDPFMETQPDINLATKFQIHLDIAAEALLSQLHHVGLFEIPEIPLAETIDLLQCKESLCVFALPLSLDFSTNVETLITAVEACLSDIDLTVNEAGFLLLVRRVWPTEMLTSYALRRLMKPVLVWILAEDERLAVILRDYVALEREIPGVRMGSMHESWPYSAKKPQSTASSTNGGDYIAHRRSLLKNYAAAWLLAFHDQDPVFYGKTCFDLVLEIAGESPVAEIGEVVDLSLRHITRLCQAFVVFTTFEDLFLLWLESTLSQPLTKPIPSLQRLLNRESNLNRRLGSIIDVTASFADDLDVTAIDPWAVIIRIASRDGMGLSQCLHWLSIFARSAVEIPETVLRHFKTLTDRFKFSVTETYPLIHAMFLCIWMRSLGRQELLGTISSVHLRLSADVSKHLNEGEVSSTITDFIRLSLAAYLLLAGCARDQLVEHGMIMESDVLQLPSRRSAVRGAMVSDPIHADTGFIRALGDYVNTRQANISVIVAKFVYLFVKKCSLLETYEVDNFIFRNAGVLSSCVWSFCEMQSSQLSSICPNLLMRIVVVDSQPLEDLLQASLSSETRWETRLHTLRQLFRIILDTINPSFVIEDRQWQLSATIFFYNFFIALIQDPQEEVRVAVDTWSQTLLPPHFEAITNCWNEALLKAPVSGRLKLVNFLIRLHPLFSSWKVLSWDVIITTLSEEDYVSDQQDIKNEPAQVNNSSKPNDSLTTDDPDITSLCISVILLGLRMISSGINVDLLTLLKLKKHLVHVLGFSNVSIRPASTSQVFYVAFDHTRSTTVDVSPCMDELLSVLDASHTFSLVASAMTEQLPPNDAPATLLVGSIFVDRLIESLLVIMFKHDMESRPLKHLQGNLRRAVLRVLNLVPTGLSYEIRQLALTVAQTYIKLWPNTSGSFVLESIDVCSQALADLESNKDNPLASQATSFIEGALSMFAENGITIALFKRTHSSTFFDVLRSCTTNSSSASAESQGLRDILLRDAISRIVDCDAESFKLVMRNLSLFIEKVYNGAYDPGLVRHIALCLTNVVRRTAEWSPESFDPGPLLLIISSVVENNPTQARDFLASVDTILRLVLSRFIISQSSLVRMLEVAKRLHLRIKKQTAPGNPRLEQNRIMSLVLEIFSEVLRRKSRIFPSTLGAMAEVISLNTKSIAISEKFQAITQTSIDTVEYGTDLDGAIAKIGVDGIAYLQTGGLHGVNVETEVNTSLSIANLILYSYIIDAALIQQLITEQPSEKSGRQSSMNVWNTLLLAALSHKSPRPGAHLMEHFPAFVAVYREALAASSSAAQGIVNAAANINHCYVSVKLWLLLERMLSQAPESRDGRTSMPKSMPFVIWNKLWPPFSDLLTAYEADVSQGQSSTLWSATSSVIADLLRFLKEFHSVLALETAVHEAILNRLQTFGQPDGPNGKVGFFGLFALSSGSFTRTHSTRMLQLARALRTISEPTPKAAWTTLLDQVKGDIIAAEKLDMMESREISKVVNFEKQWRDPGSA